MLSTKVSSKHLIAHTQFKLIVKNELVVTNVNYYSYAALVDSQRSICTIYKRIEVYDEIEELVFELDLLKENVAFMRKIIQNEIDFQNGEISEKSMRELVNEIYEEEYLGSEK